MSNTDNKGIKPPLGIKPEWLWKEERLYELNSAVIRYVSENMPIPPEWIEEIKSLREWIDKRKASYSIKEEEVGWEVVSLADTYGGGYTVYPFNCAPKEGDDRFKIHSVRRLSDGEVFTVGDEIEWNGFGNMQQAPIERFEVDTFDNTRITAYNKAFGLGFQRWVKSPKKQPFFTTMDGVQIFEGDKYFFINLDWDIRYTGDGYNWVGDGLKAFSTKEAAYEYVLLNKECLSLNDLLSVWGGVDHTREIYKQAPLFNNFKELANKKLKIN